MIRALGDREIMMHVRTKSMHMTYHYRPGDVFAQLYRTSPLMPHLPSCSGRASGAFSVPFQKQFEIIFKNLSQLLEEG